MNKITIGKKIKLIRIKNNLKIKDIAKLLGVSSSTVTYTESRLDDKNFIMRYLKLLHDRGVDLNKIFEDNVFESDNSSEKILK